MRKLRYLVRINKDPDSDWGASVLDLPGCVATGRTIDSALRRQVMRGVRRNGSVVRKRGLPEASGKIAG